jgi:hypothetical protein
MIGVDSGRPASARASERTLPWPLETGNPGPVTESSPRVFKPDFNLKLAAATRSWSWKPELAAALPQPAAASHGLSGAAARRRQPWLRPR